MDLNVYNLILKVLVIINMQKCLDCVYYTVRHASLKIALFRRSQTKHFHWLDQSNLNMASSGGTSSPNKFDSTFIMLSTEPL